MDYLSNSRNLEYCFLFLEICSPSIDNPKYFILLDLLPILLFLSFMLGRTGIIIIITRFIWSDKKLFYIIAKHWCAKHLMLFNAPFNFTKAIIFQFWNYFSALSDESFLRSQIYALPCATIGLPLPAPDHKEPSLFQGLAQITGVATAPGVAPISTAPHPIKDEFFAYLNILESKDKGYL